MSTSALSGYTRVPVAEQSKHLGAAARLLRLVCGRWATSSTIKPPVGRGRSVAGLCPCALCLWAARTHPRDFPAGAAKCLLGAKSEMWKSNTGRGVWCVLQIITFPQSPLGPQSSVRQWWLFPVVCTSRRIQIRNISRLSDLEHLDFAEVVSAVISL